ncbi:MAG: zinc ABC transporter permease subunit ZnuB [Halorhodospira halophila]|uniref:zinc ABC transporter permease subunit ZnuB n=1 Tax=Halorhodospira TaxID=85108 RepID=UPI001A92D30A|nr:MULTISPECIES: zinc ABC transporter permease subunit ZnuB [Halorhodospira]MCC3749922.1 zinc ABC transporter permease subunit ZnuB [Halorhodospira halophila]MCG5527842.1 zinc ABC transporter permease subunit ZnuB [Halorhodospira halophila]MCG5533963.1 zinc ABC transporter permease subunit ZnuB [Halorhodospira sp. 9621]MCG5536987.1 zinc ABC transporter permease subunit ZnuB [Halorhodospira sp. 9622]MCG5539717.1 zinc ABC transporter permease subunit ZnuB [Halorhodospira sp. M39old]
MIIRRTARREVTVDEFILTALAAGLGLAMVAGPLGSFVVWRRMAYFGETLAHSALLGVALGFLFGINLNLGILVVCVVVAVLLVVLRQYQRLASDTVLGILAHSSLSLGLVAIAFMEGLRVDLMGYLFGDILAVTPTDLYWIYGGGVLVLATLVGIWRPLLSLTLHEEMARVEGVRVLPVQLVFMALVAATIALAMQIVGILLVISMLIIPAAAARAFARTPEQMAVVAALIGALAVLGGLAGSFRWDLPTGPAIVVSATALFAVVTSVRGAVAARL